MFGLARVKLIVKIQSSGSTIQDSRVFSLSLCVLHVHTLAICLMSSIMIIMLATQAANVLPQQIL